MVAERLPFYLLDDVLTLDHLAKNNVQFVKVRSFHKLGFAKSASSPRQGTTGFAYSNEELGAVGVGAGVSHRQQVGLVVLHLEVLVLKSRAVD